MTHFGIVKDGSVMLSRKVGTRLLTVQLESGMFFECPDQCAVTDIQGSGVVLSRAGYKGLFSVGGPLEKGKGGYLRYIDGGSTSLLLSPPRKGDPCLNYLYFPLNHKQTRHTHPSFRFTLVFSGHGTCTVPANDDGSGGDKVHYLRPGSMFIIPAGGHHAIDATGNSPLEIFTFHPDTVIGWTNDWHPMLESTIIESETAMAHVGN